MISRYIQLGMALGGIGSLYGHSLEDRALKGLTEPPAYKISGSLVSVVIPALQEEDYLDPILTSISNQTYDPIEVIISDSSPPESKQATRQIVSEWKPWLDIKMVDSPQKNVSLGRNTGAKAAKGEVLLFMDADCILAPNFVEELVQTLNEGAILAHGIDGFYDASNELKHTLRGAWQIIKPRLHTTGRGIAIRREDCFTIGGYDEDYDPAITTLREDLDFGARVERYFGHNSVRLNKNAVVAEFDRRPYFHVAKDRVWRERGWRKGESIEGR